MIASNEGAVTNLLQPLPAAPIDRPQQRWLRPTSMRRRRAPSFTSGVDATTGTEGFRTAYDAYHETSITLAPVHNAFQLRPSATEGPSTQTDPGRLATNAGSYKLRSLVPFKEPLCLDYQDFAPNFSGFDDSGYLRCLDTFTDLVTRANNWLRQNPQMVVKTCETITWSTSRVTEVGDTENMIQQCCSNQGHQYHGEDMYCFSGLRLWVIPENISSPSMSPITFEGCNSGLRLNYRDYKSTTRNSLTYLIARVNDDLTKRSLQGNVITVETVLVPEYLPDDAGDLFWKQTTNQQPRYVAFLRIFYQPESNCQQETTIGLKNILPENIGSSYEQFSALFGRAIKWVKTEPYSTRITNFKSYNIPCTRSTLEKDANGCVHPSEMAQTPTDNSTQQYFQVLRIFYVRTSRFSNEAATDVVAAATTSPQNPRSISGSERKELNVRCAVFTPVQTSVGLNIQATFERMKQTSLKIYAWMQQNDINVCSVETYSCPLLTSTANHCLPEITFWPHQGMSSPTKCWPNEKKFLMHIRVYFESRTGVSVTDQPELSESEHNQRCRLLHKQQKKKTLQEPSVIIPSIPCRLPGAVEAAMIEEERKVLEKERRWRNRKLRLLMSCILMFAVSIPAGVLFYFNGVIHK